jgi:hypothetical protein
MNEPMVAFELGVQAFVIGAFLFFLICSLATVVMMIALTGTPEPRGGQDQANPVAGSAD